MNHDKLKRSIQTVSMNCFIQYYDLFSSSNYSYADIVEMLENENDFTLKSCRSRASHGMKIFRQEGELEALKMIIDSPRVDSSTRTEAEKIYARKTMPPIKLHQIELIQKLKKIKAKDPSCTKVYCTTCGGLSYEIEKNLNTKTVKEIIAFISAYFGRTDQLIRFEPITFFHSLFHS